MNKGFETVNSSCIAAINNDITSGSKTWGGINMLVPPALENWKHRLAGYGGNGLLLDDELKFGYTHFESEQMYYPSQIQQYGYAVGTVLHANQIYKSSVIAVRDIQSNDWIELFRSGSISVNENRLYGIIAEPNNNSTLYAYGKTTYGGDPTNELAYSNYFISTDMGASWNSGGVIGSGTPIPIVYAMGIDYDETFSYPTDTMFAGLQGKGVYRTTNGGNQWTRWLLEYDVSIRAIALNPRNSSTVYAGGDEYSSSSMWKTTNSGQSWTPLIGTNRPMNVKNILVHPSYTKFPFPNSSKYLWVLDSDGTRILKTTNGGSLWSVVPFLNSFTTVNNISNDPTNDSLIYLATATGTWKINPPPEMPLSARGFITSDVHPGIKWNRNMESDLLHYQIFRYIRRRLPNCGDLGNPEDIVPLATTVDTFYVDNMQNINPVISECGDQIGYYVIAVDKSNYISTQSSSIEFEVDGCPECWVVKNSPVNDLKNLPTEYLLHQNFPNPFNPETTIKYDLPEDIFVSLRVYDILGKEVAVLVNDYETAGFKSVKLNLSNLPSGVYIYKLIAGNYSMIQKMMLMK